MDTPNVKELNKKTKHELIGIVHTTTKRLKQCETALIA